MKIYFAGSIRGGREYQDHYANIIRILKKYGKVLTEHIGSSELGNSGETELTDTAIYLRDKRWINESDIIIAEVSNPSLGVGYELGLSEALNKSILCLYNNANPNPLSAMIAGNKNFNVKMYSGPDDLNDILATFFNKKDRL